MERKMQRRDQELRESFRTFQFRGIQRDICCRMGGRFREFHLYHHRSGISRGLPRFHKETFNLVRHQQEPTACQIGDFAGPAFTPRKVGGSVFFDFWDIGHSREGFKLGGNSEGNHEPDGEHARKRKQQRQL